MGSDKILSSANADKFCGIVGLKLLGRGNEPLSHTCILLTTLLSLLITTDHTLNNEKKEESKKNSGICTNK